MLVNRHAVRIEWADCDPAGIVYYPRYFAMFDTATHHLFEAAGWKKRDLLSEFDIVGYPMVDTRARFVIPSGFGDDIVIETCVAAIRNSSFDVEHKAFKPGPDGERLAIEAWETRVWVGRHPHDPAQLKSRPIPPVVAARLLGSDEAKHGG
jgi:4-hydroxybenzoyl-CoA thioesterase